MAAKHGRQNLSADRVKQVAQHEMRQARPWIEWLGRFGYAAKGIVYGVVGVLAAQAAFGAGGATTDTSGALLAILQQPFGQILLGVIAVGLAGYVVWRLVQAVADPDQKGSDAQGIVARVGYALSGLAYAGLALTAVQLILGSSNAGNGQTQDWTARLMAQPFGPWLVGIIGTIIVGVGLYQFYQSYTANFREKLRRAEMSAAKETWVTRLGRFGLAARGVVFVIGGIFLIRAAMQTNPGAARGLGGALATLAQQPFGPWLLGVVAAGLIAYGIYMLALARYRRMMARTNL
jgi:hypothetical protein